MKDTDVIPFIPALRGFAFKLCKNNFDAEDIVQNAILKAIKGKRNFEVGTNLKAWLFSIVKTCYLDTLRKPKKKFSKSNTVFVEKLYDSYFVSCNENSVFSNLECETILSVIDRLDGRLKDAFNLYLQGFKYDEIAEQLDIPIGTVKSRIFVARGDIQCRLRKLEYDR
jgi:RNA polymerase sigma-70 factor (ECF subfamily)